MWRICITINDMENKSVLAVWFEIFNQSYRCFILLNFLVQTRGDAWGKFVSLPIFAWESILKSASRIAKIEIDARGCCPCFNLIVSIYHLDIKPESFFVDEMARGQWSIGMWSGYSNLIWKSLTYRSWTWWRHDMAAHHSLLAFCDGNFVIMTCGLPSQRSVIVTFHIFLCCQTCQTFQLPVIWDAMTPMLLVMERSAIAIAMDNYLDWIKFKCPSFPTLSTFCLFSFLLQYLCGFIRFIFMCFFCVGLLSLGQSNCYAMKQAIPPEFLSVSIGGMWINDSFPTLTTKP